MKDFTHRWANIKDLPNLENIVNESIKELQKGFLSPEQIEASFELMGIDTQLVEDNTYLIVEKENNIVGCGGWSRRATLFGANHTQGRNATILDPKTSPARLRAMYTHPNWVRQGIGGLIMKTCEAAAIKEGFTNIELLSTLAGEALYLKSGYISIENIEIETSKGIKIPLIKMIKKLS